MIYQFIRVVTCLIYLHLSSETACKDVVVRPRKFDIPPGKSQGILFPSEHGNPAKTLKSLFVWNRWTDFNETLYAALRILVDHRFYKSWPWVDFDLFYGKVKFDH